MWDFDFFLSLVYKILYLFVKYLHRAHEVGVLGVVARHPVREQPAHHGGWQSSHGGEAFIMSSLQSNF